jgi:hypothetical protein
MKAKLYETSTISSDFSTRTTVSMGLKLEKMCHFGIFGPTNGNIFVNPSANTFV